MSLLSKPTLDLSWSDVLAFCESQITEGTTLDYKGEFPKELERTVAAMANTLGGLILIGVADDKHGKPVLPLVGMPIDTGLAERVLNICATTITPPVVPVVKVCADSANANAVVVLRVDQSRAAPHAISSNTRVYVRTGQRNDPDELANLERIAWLMESRRKSESFREWLFSRATERFRLLTLGRVPHIAGSVEHQASAAELPPCLLTIALVPTYPATEPLALPERLNAIRREIVMRDRMGTCHEFPLQESPIHNRLVEDGVVMHLSGRGGLRTYHTHLNMHGLYFFKQSLLYGVERKNERSEARVENVMRLSELVERVYAMLATGSKFYAKVGYSGPVDVHVALERILGWPLLESSDSFGDSSLRYSADPQIDVSERFSTEELIVKGDHIAHRLVRRVGWAFDLNIAEEGIQRTRPQT